MKTPHVKLIGRSPLRLAFLLIPLALVCLALLPQARAVCQDACLTNSNTVQGDDALFSLTTGAQNTAVGFDALYNVTTGNQNTALGYSALLNNTTGGNSTAVGAYSLLNNTSSDNTAYGAFSLQNNTIGNQNTAIGQSALSQNVMGNFNTAVGVDALHNNFSDRNTAVGWSALASNMPGVQNTATGAEALRNNVGGSDNTASGFQTLLSNTSGNDNVVIGGYAGSNNSTGNNNIAIGAAAGINLTTGNNNIDIGNNGVAGESNTIRIGTNGTRRRAFIAGISGVTVSGGAAVYIKSNGQLGTVTSSGRFKDAIEPMDKASEAIFALSPVTFRYKTEIDPEGVPEFGLVAEEVEKVNPDLVVRDADGKAFTVRYDAVNAMLLNEFLKEHRTVQEQKETIAQLKQDFAEQQKQIEALTAGLQKVSAQIELSKPAPRTVGNNQ